MENSPDNSFLANVLMFVLKISSLFIWLLVHHAPIGQKILRISGNNSHFLTANLL
jgi:hypothetical protein